MGRLPATREFLGRLVEWAGGKASFCRQTGITTSNLADYQAGRKNIEWKRLKRATEEVFSGTPAPREYLIELVSWAGGAAQFCSATGIQRSNLSDYQRGRKTIGWNRLQLATKQVLGEPPAFVPLLEGYNYAKDGAPKLSILPRQPGIYALFDSAMRTIYYGKAKTLYGEVRQTLNRVVHDVRPLVGRRKVRYKDITTYLSAYTIARGDEAFRHDVEVFGLRFLLNNTFNKNGGNFRRKG